MPNDLHTRVAAAILEQLETADPASWTPPWHGADPMPRNASTGRRYRGIKILALWCAAQANGYTDARWATYRQWTALGAQVRRAERSTLVLFYKELPRGTQAEAETHDSKKPAGVPFVARAAHVFNVAQVDTAPPRTDTPSSGTTILPPPAFDRFVTATSATIHEGGTRACYVPATDTIHMPARASFHSTKDYAGTLAHELIHWTGAPHRLARDLTGRFDARSYAAEELVAELGAAFILADLGIARVPHPNHAAYYASWAPLLRANPHALATAATQGSRAADYLTTLQPRTEVLAERSDATGASAASTTFLNESAASAPMRAANRTRATVDRQRVSREAI
ncbi:zincin-like metallopeptidase domain-containing protein [Methylobacterium sp. Leaf93]|uniref:ArdC family protein n=1 Tax=Methylobacterium sp. Leaf93 TaxID=1736249 RepID=UPI0006F75183|nr:zincin-like metallopeptidase domain-containing protein [Methylobacterium sp. Leaf93]KQP14688.1 antirestriction protein ArdC [Methylobacterium sp. Leaf93]